MIVNLNDKDFGNSTGVALEMKYKPMLNLATLKARLIQQPKINYVFSNQDNNFISWM